MPIPSSTHRVATIFGGSGFIGRYVVRELAKRGWRVRVATRHPDGALFLKPMGSVGQIAPILANIRDDRSVAGAIEGADFVINLVGILAESRRQTFQNVHVEAPARIARIATAAGVERVVQVSAIGASARSESAYARSKAAGEEAVLENFPDATIIRPSVAFGAEDKFFNFFGGMARFSPFLPLIGGGHTRMQPVWSADVAEAIQACLERRATRGATFELGGPQIYTFRALMELLLQVTNRRRLLLPIPWGAAMLQANILERLPYPLLTRDQVIQLKSDNVVSDDAATFADLGIEPTAAELILPTYLERFRIGGQFSRYRQSRSGSSNIPPRKAI